VRVGISLSKAVQERTRVLLLTSAVTPGQLRAFLDCAASFPSSSHVQSPPSGFTLTTYDSCQIPECASHIFLGASIAEAGTTIAELDKLASVTTRTALVTAGDREFVLIATQATASRAHRSLRCEFVHLVRCCHIS